MVGLPEQKHNTVIENVYFTLINPYSTSTWRLTNVSWIQALSFPTVRSILKSGKYHKHQCGICLHPY